MSLSFEKSVVNLKTVDVANSDDLFEKYGESVPVLSDDKSELNWPFTPTDVQDWLKPATASSKST